MLVLVLAALFLLFVTRQQDALQCGACALRDNALLARGGRLEKKKKHTCKSEREGIAQIQHDIKAMAV